MFCTFGRWRTDRLSAVQARPGPRHFFWTGPDPHDPALFTAAKTEHERSISAVVGVLWPPINCYNFDTARRENLSHSCVILSM